MPSTKPSTRDEELRAKAVECLGLAQRASDPIVRKELMQLAARFRHLAARVEADAETEEPVTAAAVIEAHRRREARRAREPS